MVPKESCAQLSGALVLASELKHFVVTHTWGRNHGPLYRLHFVLQPALPLLLHSPVSNCLNLLFGTQEESRRLKEAYFLQTRKGQGKDLYPKGPTRSCCFKLLESVSYKIHFIALHGKGLSRTNTNLKVFSITSEVFYSSEHATLMYSNCYL